MSQETEQKIPELLPYGVVDPNTVFVLTNTVYFNASWAEPFEEALTKPGTFTRVDGSAVQVPMMHGSRDGGLFAEGDGWKAAELPYDGQEVSMLLVVPDAGRFS